MSWNDGGDSIEEMRSNPSKGSAMLPKLRSYRPGHGTVVAYLALFVALGGTSYGLASGSIDSREIRNNTVRSQDIRNNVILSRDIRNGALLARDFKPGQLPAGPQGATGPRGPQGLRGPSTAYFQGSGGMRAGVLNLPAGKYLVTYTAQVSNFSDSGISAECAVETRPAGPRIPDSDTRATVPPGSGTTLTSTFGLDSPSGNTIALRCNSAAGPIRLAAIQVGSLEPGPTR